MVYDIFITALVVPCFFHFLYRVEHSLSGVVWGLTFFSASGTGTAIAEGRGLAALSACHQSEVCSSVRGIEEGFTMGM